MGRVVIERAVGEWQVSTSTACVRAEEDILSTRCDKDDVM